jgi:hypothetical protein
LTSDALAEPVNRYLRPLDRHFFKILLPCYHKCINSSKSRLLGYTSHSLHINHFIQRSHLD